jgi:hypothetical protein
MNSTGRATITDVDDHVVTIDVSLFIPGDHPLVRRAVLSVTAAHPMEADDGALAGQQLYLPWDVYRYDDN